jgi:hypothetical protein
MPAAGACGARRLTDANEPILPRNVHVGFGTSLATRVSDAPALETGPPPEGVLLCEKTPGGMGEPGLETCAASREENTKPAALEN